PVPRRRDRRRSHRTRARRARPRRHRVGRDGRDLAGAAVHPRHPGLAGGRGGLVPLLRHRQAAPGALGRPRVQGWLRRDGRRSLRGRLHAARAGRPRSCFWHIPMNPGLALLSERVGRVLAARGWTMSTAESCTGGWIAEVVTATAGSSAWFDRGFVTYSNAAKQEMLGVGSDTLARHGAVSEQTVR